MIPASKAAARIRNLQTGKLGVSTQRVNAMIRSGILSAVRDPHGYYLIDPEEISRFNRSKRAVGRPRGSILS